MPLLPIIRQERKLKKTKEELAFAKIIRDKKKQEELIAGADKRDRETCFSERQALPIKQTFKVGEQVKYGGFNTSEIVEIYNDGHDYKLLVFRKSTGHSESFDAYLTRYACWYNISKLSCLRAENIFQENRMQIQFYQTMLSCLVSLVRRPYNNKLGTRDHTGEVDMNPEYQRGFVWSDEKKQELLYSIMHGYDIGKFTLIRRVDYSSDAPLYEILDGKQRISTILEFYEDKLPYICNGKKYYYSKLSSHDKHQIDSLGISKGETRGKITNKQAYEYFLQLNTGVPIEPTHLDKVKALLKKEK